MRCVLLAVVLCFSVTAGSSAGELPRSISVAGASLRLPVGWQAVAALTPDCDPERLIVASSGPLLSGSSGSVVPPRRGQVTVLLLEDRYRQDRPSGDLRRPARFSIAWSRLVQVKPLCGSPDRPAFMRAFRVHGRYFVFIVYPGTQISPQTRAETLSVLDSVRVK